MRLQNAVLALVVSCLTLGGSVVPLAAESGFEALDPARTVYLELEGGRVVLELAPAFAPRHVEQFLRLVRKHFYDGLTFYRVIDGFVAQGGDGSDLSGKAEQPTLPAEFERAWSDDLPWTAAQAPDLFAPETGFVAGFPAARDPKEGKVWLTHCPGALALARGNEPDSAATDFYIVIGQAPRYLDRNLTIFGRVVLGMEIVQGIRRGPADNDGVIEDEGKRTKILSLRVAADLPAKDRWEVERTDTSSDTFRSLLDSRKNRTHPFFHRTPPAVLDVCQVPLAAHRGKAPEAAPAKAEK